MTKTEVTVAQYEECVTAGGCTSPSSGGHCNWNDPGYENHPVNCVEWFEAEDFCMWAGGRLPTEAEWEYAARSGGQDITYPWGDETATCTYAVMGEDMQGYYDDGCGTLRTMIVCSKTLGNTVQGLCDMAGNVYEWVQDWYHSDYNGAPVDGSAWLEDPDPYYDRVIRGGSQEEPADKLRAADRSYIDPSYNYCDIKTIGFRCAR
jgi:iron(II)-dependent oxidoreductase